MYVLVENEVKMNRNCGREHQDLILILYINYYNKNSLKYIILKEISKIKQYLISFNFLNSLYEISSLP